ncbi:MAG: beta-propeller fold lactonase family protein, partial [Chloroflexi bacterium]|nr:beta-propeller fold lactonase family protein [Chloroflexota bacterium]
MRLKRILTWLGIALISMVACAPGPAGPAIVVDPPELTLIDVVEDGQGGLPGLEQVESVAFSPDDQRVYALSGTDATISLFGVDADSRDLRLIDQVTAADPADPLHHGGSLVVSPDGRYLYVAVHVVEPSRPASFFQIATYQLGDDGLPRHIETFTQPLRAFGQNFEWADLLDVSPDGRFWLIHTRYTPDQSQRTEDLIAPPSLIVLERDAESGQLTALTTEQDLQDYRGLLPTASPDGRWLIWHGTDEQAILWGRDMVSGELTPASGIDLPVLNGLWYSPDGQTAYSNESSGYSDQGGLQVYRVQGDGSLALQQTIYNAAARPYRITRVHHTPDERSVYVMGFTERDDWRGWEALPAIDIYDLDDGQFVFDRRLFERDDEFAAAQAIRSSAVSRDGEWLIAVSQIAGVEPPFGLRGIKVFAVDDGDLIETQALYAGQDGWLGLTNPVLQTISPNGEQAYVVGWHRPAQRWVLSIVALEAAGLRLIDQLFDVRVLLLADEGQHAYLRINDEIAFYQRDPQTGLLSHVETYDDFPKAKCISLPPDAQHLYVCPHDRDDANEPVIPGVGAYVRREDGRLALLGEQPIPSLPNRSGPLWSPDGRFAYRYNSQFIDVVYRRDPLTGLLGYEFVGPLPLETASPVSYTH